MNNQDCRTTLDTFGLSALASAPLTMIKPLSVLLTILNAACSLSFGYFGLDTHMFQSYYEIG